MASINEVVDALGVSLGDPNYKTYDRSYCQNTVKRSWQELIKILPKETFRQYAETVNLTLSGATGLRRGAVTFDNYFFHVYDAFILRNTVLIPIKNRKVETILYPETSNSYLSPDEDIMYFYQSGNSVYVYYKDNILNSIYIERTLILPEEGIYDEFVSYVIEMVTSHLRSIEGNLQESIAVLDAVMAKIRIVYGVSNDTGEGNKSGSGEISQGGNSS